MNDAKLIWSVPESDELIAYIARVSNPDNQDNESIEGLLNYMMREGHTSPFTMINFCVEINTTRDISRQILRHWSFDFQEFSQRYEDVSKLGEMVERECRLQDVKNRQNSIETSSSDHIGLFRYHQEHAWSIAIEAYNNALQNGIAKEQARALLPEGLTPTRMYMNGNLRSWIFYLKQRLHPSTQKEHRLVAESVLEIFKQVAPVTAKAFFGDEN